MRFHHDSVFDEFLHAIKESIPVAASRQPVNIIAFSTHVLRVRLWNRGLAGNGEHAHPVAQNTQWIDRIEGLRAAGNLRNGERSPLSRSHTTNR